MKSRDLPSFRSSGGIWNEFYSRVNMGVLMSTFHDVNYLAYVGGENFFKISDSQPKLWALIEKINNIGRIV